MSFKPGAYSGTLHNYAPRLVAFEHASASRDAPCNFILFLAGLGDALMTVRYPSVLAALLPPSWGLVEVQLSSSGTGWTTGSLECDSNELAKAIAYFRQIATERNLGHPAKTVLLGHSTGCQIAVNYLVGPWKSHMIPQAVTARPAVDGVILQAGISDREAVKGLMSNEEISSSLGLAKSWIEEGRGQDQLPISSTKLVFGASPSAERWVSLLDEYGHDDYFSSDLAKERLQRVWGERGLATRGVRLMVLLGEKDNGMPASVDKAKLLSTCERQVKGSNGLWDDQSGVVKDAYHNLNGNDEHVVKDLCEKCVSFVQSVNPDFAGKL